MNSERGVDTILLPPFHKNEALMVERNRESFNLKPTHENMADVRAHRIVDIFTTGVRRVIPPTVTAHHLNTGATSWPFQFIYFYRPMNRIVFLFISCRTQSAFGDCSFQSPVLGESASMYYQSQSPQRGGTKSEEPRAVEDDQRFYQDLLVRVVFYRHFLHVCQQKTLMSTAPSD